MRALSTEGGFTGVGTAICPANDFSMPVEPGSYLVRVGLPLDQPRGQLPQRWLEPGPVIVDDADVVKDVNVRNGSPLAGRVTVDGNTPVSGLNLSAAYADLPGGFGAGFGISGSTGTWQDLFVPSRLMLQRGIRYTFTGCQGPASGIREIRVSPAGPFLFPEEANRLDCDFITGDALPYTHQATRLKLTSYPGDIGGLSDPIIFSDLGYGYSAQFPLPAGAPPIAGPGTVNRQLFRGGLVLAVAPDVALGGTELEGYVFCSVSPCRTFGFDGQATVTPRSGGRKDVTWAYSDAGSQRPRGLQVTQRSFDGRNGADYILYVFRITNRGTATVTFTPGLFLDFDISPDIGNNIGYTDLDGRLMITTNADDVGPHLGSVIVQSPAGGRNYFFMPAIPESEVVGGIQGEISNPETILPSDWSTLHGGTTVTVKKKKSTDFWVAIVAGADRAQTIANAQAAIADAAARQRAGNPFASTTSDRMTHTSVNPVTRAAAAVKAGRICKTGCGPD